MWKRYIGENKKTEQFQLPSQKAKIEFFLV